MQAAGTKQIRIDCAYCPVRHRAVCASCVGDEIDLLNAIKHYKSYQAGQTVALQGERNDFVASVVTGVATLTRTLEDGRTQVVGLLLPSDFLGRPGRDTVAHDVTATTDITLCCFQKRPFEKLLLDVPHLNERLLEMSLDELDAAREWMLLLGRKTAREKVASFLLMFARRSATSDPGDEETATHIDLPLSREIVGNYLGLTIETVSRQMTALRKDGVIEMDGARSIVIHDTDALENAADGIL